MEQPKVIFTPDDGITDEKKKLLLFIVNTTRDIYLKRKKLQACAFVMYGDKFDIVGFTVDEYNRPWIAKQIKEAIKKRKADGCVFLSETYSIFDEAAKKEYWENRALYEHSIRNHPMARDSITFMYETRYAHWMALVEATPSDGLFAETVNFVKMSAAGGIFANLIDKDMLH